MSEFDEIKQELQDLEVDIPNQIKTGIPKNVKSQNVRSIHQRTVDASKRMLDLFEAFSENENLLQGNEDPNIEPPLEDFGPGYFYLRWGGTEFSRFPIAFYVYTGVPELQWLQLLKSDSTNRIYGTSANPNSVQIINTPNRMVGDFYIETSTGNADGNIISTWIYVGINAGSLWLKLENTESYSIKYTAQHIDHAQQTQALLNLGIRATVIDNEIHFYKKHPDNNGNGLEIKDFAFNLMKDGELISVAQYNSGDGSDSSHWTAIGNSIEF